MQDYEDKKIKAAALQAQKSLVGRNIAPLPSVKNPARRAAALESLTTFGATYFSATLNKPCSPAHLLLIAKLEEVIQQGGLFAIGMPRGWGKSAWCRIAILWGILRGARKFGVLIAANATMARKLLANVRKTLESDGPLLDDFPECLYPIRRLNHINGKAAGQHINGVSTCISLRSEQLILPTVEGSPASGAIICAAGLDTGGLRGLHFVTETGETLRPDVFLADDIQSKKSAYSVGQCEYREGILQSDVLFLGGDTKIAGLVACTIIREGDVADRILDRKIFPVWQGIRTRMFDAMPKSMELWERYWEIRSESFLNDGKGEQATQHYIDNQPAMDEGCIPVWPEKYEEGEISAVQHGMNLFFNDRRAFASECQGEPLAIGPSMAVLLDADAIAAKTERGRKRLTFPTIAETLVAFIDCHQKMLYYGIGAFCPNFTGWLIDYGTFPDQRRNYFTLADGRFSLKQKYPGTGDDGSLLAGVRDFLDDLLGREYRRDDGTVLRIKRCLVDSGWKTSVVHQAIRQSKYAALVMPSKGVGITASNKPFSEYRHYPGDKVGEFWRIPGQHGRRELRTVNIDSNHYKSKLMSALATPLGDPGCLALFEDKSGHRMLVDHLLAEYSVDTEGRGRKVQEWKVRPDRQDQHLLDVTAGLFVAASMEGCSTVGAIQPRAAAGSKQRRITYANESPVPTPVAQVSSPTTTAPVTRRRRITYLND